MSNDRLNVKEILSGCEMRIITVDCFADSQLSKPRYRDVLNKTYNKYKRELESYSWDEILQEYLRISSSWT